MATGSRLGCGRGRGRCYLGMTCTVRGAVCARNRWTVDSLAHPQENPPTHKRTRPPAREPAHPQENPREPHRCGGPGTKHGSRPHSRYVPWPLSRGAPGTRRVRGTRGLLALAGLVALAAHQGRHIRGLLALAGLVALAAQQARRVQASTIDERAAPLAMVPAVAVRPTTGSVPRPRVSSGCCRALNAAQLGWASVRGERGGPMGSVPPSQGLICSLIVKSGSADRARRTSSRATARRTFSRPTPRAEPPHGPSSRPRRRRPRRSAAVAPRCPSTCMPFRSIRRGTQGSARLAWYRCLPDHCSVDRATRRLAATGRSTAPASGSSGPSDGTSRSL